MPMSMPFSSSAPPLSSPSSARAPEELVIYDLDISPMPPAGVAQDLIHLERKCTVKGYVGKVNEPPMNFMEDLIKNARQLAAWDPPPAQTASIYRA